MKCKAPWEWVWIGIDGSVSFCCYQRILGPDLVLGNINVDTLENILNNPLAQAIRNQVKNEKSPDVCKGCPLFKNKEPEVEP